MRPPERANLFGGKWRGAGIMNNLPSPALLVVRGGACSLARPFPGFPPLLSLPPPLNVHLMHGRLGRQNGPGLTRNFARVVAAADSSPAELARAALWSETQKWGPRGARGKTPAQWWRPAQRRAQRGVKRRARRDGLRRRGRRIGGQAQRPPPRPTWSAFDDFACPPLLPSRSVGRNRAGC